MKEYKVSFPAETILLMNRIRKQEGLASNEEVVAKALGLYSVLSDLKRCESIFYVDTFTGTKELKI